MEFYITDFTGILLRIQAVTERFERDKESFVAALDTLEVPTTDFDSSIQIL
jgi:hypothetical protein